VSKRKQAKFLRFLAVAADAEDGMEALSKFLRDMAYNLDHGNRMLTVEEYNSGVVAEEFGGKHD